MIQYTGANAHKRPAVEHFIRRAASGSYGGLRVAGRLLRDPKSSGLLRPELQRCFAPTVSAMVAPRAPMGFGLPVVVSRTV